MPGEVGTWGGRKTIREDLANQRIKQRSWPKLSIVEIARYQWGLEKSTRENLKCSTGPDTYPILGEGAPVRSGLGDSCRGPFLRFAKAGTAASACSLLALALALCEVLQEQSRKSTTCLFCWSFSFSSASSPCDSWPRVFFDLKCPSL